MKTTALKLLMLLIGMAFAPALAQAQVEGNPDNWCRNGAFTDDAAPFRTGTVGGARGERTYFYSDDADCPGGSDAKCRRKAYLVAGDEVIVTRRFDRFICAWFQPAKGSETVGWLPADRLALRDVDRNPPLALWMGEWEFYDNSVSIRRGSRAGRLKLEGQAFWRGLGDNIHVGEIGGEAAPRAGEITLEDDICRVSLRLVGRFLVVNDNNHCGGHNVTFDGIYRRKAQRRGR